MLVRKTVYYFLFVGLFLLAACNQNKDRKHPDVDNISVTLAVQHFEKDLFQNPTASFQEKAVLLQTQYPKFFPFFNDYILGLKGAPLDTQLHYVQLYTNDYKPVADSAAQVFKNFDPSEKSIVKLFKHIKYYFPKAVLPSKLITYVGPLDGYGDVVIAEDSILAIGLQFHLGKQYTGYALTQVQEVYPAYISARFEPDYIAIHAAKVLLNELYPVKESEQPLIDQMIEQGKRLYILSQLLPDDSEHKIIGYTEAQMKDCYAHEAVIWDLFIKNNYLQLTDKNLIKNYLDEGPKTQELGEGAPGNIGSFAGWQIIKKYMAQHPEMSLIDLMKTNTDAIFQAAKYKP